jgi:RNA polymerase-binding protein DksA
MIRDVTRPTVSARRSSVVRSAAKATPTKTTATKTTATKTTPTKTTQAKKAATRTAAEQEAPAQKVAVKKAPAAKAPAAKVPAKAPAKADGDPAAARTKWTAAELKAIRAELSVEIAAMQVEYERSLAELDELQQAGTDGAGDDQADAGAKTFDREQELSIANNRFDLLSQMMHAVERIDSGTYGYCEVCGNPIPLVRLQAFPMATLDVACKQREERR